MPYSESFLRVRRALGIEVRQLRKHYGWTLQDLQRVSGLQQGALSRIENAKGNPSLRTLEKLAKAFGRPLHEFVRAVEERARRGAKGGLS